MEGHFTKCLGIGTQQRGSGTICMTQKGSIKKIIATAKMKECDPNKIPAPTTAPGLDAEGKHLDHASVIGMLLCMSNNGRPDITFAVSQAA